MLLWGWLESQLSNQSNFRIVYILKFTNYVTDSDGVNFCGTRKLQETLIECKKSRIIPKRNNEEKKTISALKSQKLKAGN